MKNTDIIKQIKLQHRRKLKLQQRQLRRRIQLGRSYKKRRFVRRQKIRTIQNHSDNEKDSTYYNNGIRSRMRPCPDSI